MADDPTENTPWREGENYDEMMSEEPFDDEEELDAEEAERRITQFIMSAEKLPGPPVEELAERVTALMQAASRDLETIMEGKPHNKVLATQLLLGQRARGLQQLDPEQWPLSAATTLLSRIVIRGAQR
jgi:hypothetical protein